MIRFSAALVVVAIGVLIGGVAASSLLLVYVAIGVSAVALLVLVAGVALKRDELLTGDTGSSATGVGTLGTGTGAVQQAASGGIGEARVPAAAGASTFGGASSQQDAPAGRGTGAPPWSSPQPPAAQQWAPGAWPPREPGFPSAPASGEAGEVASGASASGPAAPEDRPSVFTPSSRRRAPMAPPTRADPVVPWADSMPTRIEVGKANLPEPAEAETTRVERIIPDNATRAERIIPADATRAERIIPAADGVAGDKADSSEDGITRPAGDAGLTVAFDVSHEDVEDPAVAEEAAAADDIDGADGTSDAHSAGAVSDEPADVAEVPAEVTAAMPAPDTKAPVADVPEAETDSRRVTVVPGVPRYHHDDCILVRFLDDGDVDRISVTEAEQSGCTPCRACHPED